MRRTRALLSGAVLIGCLSAGAAAQTPARDDAPGRPATPARDDGANRPDRADGPDRRPFAPRGPGDRRTEKGAYLGVATSPPPPALRRQLGLPGGVGLVVDAVADDSPAAEAGLKRFDVLHKLNDQLLVNQQQLAVLVRTCKPGDAVKLAVVREGKPTEVSAKLVERDLPPLDDLRLGADDPFRLPFEDRRFGPDRIEPEAGREPFAGGAGPVPPDVRRAFPPGLVNEEFSLAWDDGKVSMSLTSKGGKRTLVAKDRDGKELYNGPLDTPEDREKLPPEVKERLPRVGLPGGFRPGNQRPGPGEARPNGEPRPHATRPAREDGPRPPAGRQVIEWEVEFRAAR